MEFSLLSHFALVAQLSLGVVFLISTLPKLRQPLTFAQSVVEYRILPTHVTWVFGLALIPLEAFLAFAFLTGFLADSALPLAIAMLVAFLIAVGINLRRGRKISCGCFGNDSEPISLRTLTRLSLLLIVVLLLFGFRNLTGLLPVLPMFIVDPPAFTYWLLTLLLALALMILSAWLLNLPELIALARYLRQISIAAENAKKATEST